MRLIKKALRYMRSGDRYIEADGEIEATLLFFICVIYSIYSVIKYIIYFITIPLWGLPYLIWYDYKEKYESEK